MNVYESIWSSMMVIDYIRKQMNVYEPIWWYLKVYDSVWV